ncbi:hypothetical protein [Croceicoccus naphthovorans]|uniref:hypothetical protein n=1 Tax=Croceicoccus naphthovorans TaxID=1348774 RepID=UPI000ABB28F3|nr:hypothetical protein [Croceicoccus naphthovorans]MBB3992301.1 hypothetical protein [Croceicoccus naphthovorans]
MFDRLSKQSPLAVASAISLVAMLALNVFALSQQVHEAPRYAAPASIVQGQLA